MYQSTDKLVSNEQGVGKNDYQTIEGGVAGTGGDEPVPQSLLSQVKKAREENIGCCNFCLAFFALIIGSIVWTLVIIIIITVPIVMIVIGAEYFHNCPIQKMIPISLIVAGSVAMLSNVINFVDRFKRLSESGMPRRHTVIGWVNLVINIFLAAWFIATCYWIYSASGAQFEKEELSTYCNPHLYGFVFWLVNFIFIFFGTMVVISAIVMCFALMCW